MEKAAKIFTVAIVIALLLSATALFIAFNTKYTYEEIEYPLPLEPRNHDISRVEDLFIAFEYEHNTSYTFVMTENFTELSIVIQPDRRGINGTVYRHEVEIDGTAKVVVDSYTSYPCVIQATFMIEGLRYNAIYTLTFTGGSGVAVAV